MILNASARMYYSVAVATSPALPDGTVWSASFDGGTTWVAGEADPETVGSTRWLVAGPSATPTDATVITKQTTYPLLACDVGDEHIIAAPNHSISLVN